MNDLYETENILPVLIVQIGEESYAVKALTIVEVVPMMRIQHIPDIPAFLEGFIDIRGAIYPVVDLWKYFGGKREQHVLSSRIILIRCKKRNMGFIVDDIIGMEEWQPKMYQAGILSNDVKDAFTGEVGQTEAGDIQVLNLCQIISDEELATLATREQDESKNISP